MTNTVIDVAHKTAVGGTGLILSKIVGECNEVVGLFIGVSTLTYAIIKVRIALIDFKNKKESTK